MTKEIKRALEAVKTKEEFKTFIEKNMLTDEELTHAFGGCNMGEAVECPKCGHISGRSFNDKMFCTSCHYVW